MSELETGLWVLLCYRLPREPSTPRITVWRKLKRLGVAQLSDGLVTLPAAGALVTGMLLPLILP